MQVLSKKEIYAVYIYKFSYGKILSLYIHI